MARIEAQAYQLLAQLGASPVKSVMTAGGGAVNETWTALRAAALGVLVKPAQQGEHCLAQHGRWRHEWQAHVVDANGPAQAMRWSG